MPLATVAARFCILCCACRNACPLGAITILGDVRIDAERCDGCGACIAVCVPGALTLEERAELPAVQSPDETR